MGALAPRDPTDVRGQEVKCLATVSRRVGKMTLESVAP